MNGSLGPVKPFHGQALPSPPDNKYFLSEESFAENHLKGGERILSRVDVLWRISRWGDGGQRTSMMGRATTTMVGRGAMVAELGGRLVLRLMMRRVSTCRSLASLSPLTC